MCFSPQASFTAAAFTGAIGLVALARMQDRREVMLAAAPVIFGVQQTIEGLLWLNLPHAPHGLVSTGLAYLFLFVAEVFWPIYAPVAVLILEPDPRRRRLIWPCLAAGLGVAGYMLWTIVTRSHGAVIIDDHIVYLQDAGGPELIGLAYLAATGLPLLLSSRRAVQVLGAVVLVGLVAAYLFYWEAFISVWCFFAAAASGVILAHFEWERRWGAAGPIRV